MVGLVEALRHGSDCRFASPVLSSAECQRRVGWLLRMMVGFGARVLASGRPACVSVLTGQWWVDG